MVSEGGVTTKRLIQKIEPTTPIQPRLLRVAAYARVSSGKDAMLHSLSVQVSYYNDLIQGTPEWLFCGIYADEAMTGTKENRTEFQKMLTACRNGEINLIITKSISRFARNTVTLLETVRELKDLGVDVFFEEQNIHTMSADGELMLTILSSYAQEESFSASENQKWRIRRDFEQGRVSSMRMLGYHRTSEGRLEIIPVSPKFTLMIDYAHNAMALESLLNSLREYHPKRLVTLFGCGGNRDPHRRYEMGDVSSHLSDLTVVTSDNPRFEEPMDIIKDIITGVKRGTGKYVTIPDRKEAIKYCIDNAEEGDVIILAGKGHEDYQEIKGIKYPMDERVLIQEILEGR